jgi:hypothetical protein
VNHVPAWPRRRGRQDHAYEHDRTRNDETGEWACREDSDKRSVIVNRPPHFHKRATSADDTKLRNETRKPRIDSVAASHHKVSEGVGAYSEQYRYGKDQSLQNLGHRAICPYEARSRKKCSGHGK